MTNLNEIRQQLEAGKINMVDLVKQYLAKIKEHARLNIYIEVYEKEALERAAILDQKIAKNENLGSLHGIVASVKDVICIKNHKVTAGSKMLDNFESQLTSTAIQRAIDQDIIIIGRTNCDEFAMGSSNEHSVYGPTLNGADPERVPGGSSGAAAVSVQMNTCLVAFGSDTGGSVRQPASFCGVIGMKPTYGRISRYGLIAYASSFDQIGILSKDIDALAETLWAVEGKDDLDSTSIDLSSVKSTDWDNPSYCYFPEVLDHPKLSSDIKHALKEKIEKLKANGHKVKAVSFDLIDYLVPTYYVLTTAEASSNLNRYDGIRYGYQKSDKRNINDLYIENRSAGFGTEVKRRIMMGTFVLSVGYFDAYFNKAQKVRRLIIDKLDRIFSESDILLMPTTTDIAWRLGEKVDDPVEMYLSDIFTVLANLAGLPAISLPQESSGMPFGLQLLAKNNNDHLLLQASRNF